MSKVFSLHTVPAFSYTWTLLKDAKYQKFFQKLLFILTVDSMCGFILTVFVLIMFCLIMYHTLMSVDN